MKPEAVETTAHGPLVTGRFLAPTPKRRGGGRSGQQAPRKASPEAAGRQVCRAAAPPAGRAGKAQAWELLGRIWQSEAGASPLPPDPLHSNTAQWCRAPGGQAEPCGVGSAGSAFSHKDGGGSWKEMTCDRDGPGDRGHCSIPSQVPVE